MVEEQPRSWHAHRLAKDRGEHMHYPVNHIRKEQQTAIITNYRSVVYIAFVVAVLLIKVLISLVASLPSGMGPTCKKA